jgi:hypothetical protein
VFEKKAREAEAGAKEKAGDGQKGAADRAKPKKGKSLLDGVRMK